MFQFNFSETDENVNESLKKSVGEQNENIKESVKIEVSSDQYAEIAEEVKVAKVNCFLSNDIEIGYLDNKTLTDESDTDLIPRVYEGGFKIWECSQDLADLLTSCIYSNEFTGKTVCDLGCSAGVLGIIALINKAKRVDFQDYVSSVNEDWLRIIDIFLNSRMKTSSRSSRSRM